MSKIKQPITNGQAVQLNKHFIDAANLLVNKFKTPAAFIKFLSFGLAWIDNYNRLRLTKEEKVQCNYFLIQLIQDVALPWLTGKDVVNKIAKGLFDINEYCTWDGFYEGTGIIIKALGADLQEGFPFNDNMAGYLSSIDTLYKVSYCVEMYSIETGHAKQLAKLLKETPIVTVKTSEQ